MIRIILCYVAFAALSIFGGGAYAQSRGVITYHYTPHKSELYGYMQTKKVTLDDPKLTFTVSILVLNKAISVPESGSYDAVAGETHVQLQFQKNIKIPPSGVCLDVIGELAGAETATDIYPLIMRVDSYRRCNRN